LLHAGGCLKKGEGELGDDTMKKMKQFKGVMHRKKE